MITSFVELNAVEYEAIVQNPDLEMDMNHSASHDNVEISHAEELQKQAEITKSLFPTTSFFSLFKLKLPNPEQVIQRNSDLTVSYDDPVEPV